MKPATLHTSSMRLFKKVIGQLIRAKRQKRGLNVYMIADASGYSWQWIEHLENGNSVGSWRSYQNILQAIEEY